MSTCTPLIVPHGPYTVEFDLPNKVGLVTAAVYETTTSRASLSQVVRPEGVRDVAV